MLVLVLPTTLIGSTVVRPAQAESIDSNYPAAASMHTAQWIQAGTSHTCVGAEEGKVLCWGANGLGQLGDGSTINRLAPVNMGGLNSEVTAIAAGNAHTCVLKVDGSVKCYGYYDLMEPPSIWTRPYPDFIHDWRTADLSTLGNDILAIASGDDHTCGLTLGGAVKCWGDNGHGQLGDGTIVDHLTPVEVSVLSSGVIAISASDDHTCAVMASGGVKCWGSGFSLTPRDVIGLESGVAEVATGYNHSCALTTNGGVKCWGDNYHGELGDGTNTGGTPVDVIGLDSGVIEIAAGSFYSCALTVGGAVKCWGDNFYGVLGDGTKTSRNSPVDVVGLSGNVVAIAAGDFHMCGITADGGVWCWGNNPNGELGTGTRVEHLTPGEVVGFGGALGSYSVAGYAATSDGRPIAGATVFASSGQAAVTGPDGRYLLEDLPNGTVTLTAEKGGYDFIEGGTDIVTPPITGSGPSFRAYRLPIVFVPDLMGSRLFNHLNEEVWVDVQTLSSAFGWDDNPLRVLELEPNGWLSRFPEGSGIYFKWGRQGVIDRIQGSSSPTTIVDDPINAPLIEHFESLGYREGVDFFIFNYDWRKDLAQTEQSLFWYLNNVVDPSHVHQVYLVGHGTGGVIVNHVLHRGTEPNYYVRRAVIIAAPLLGTPLSFAMPLAETCLHSERSLGCIPNPEVLKNLAINYPSIYEQMPNAFYFAARGSGFVKYGQQDIGGGSYPFCPGCLAYDSTYSIQSGPGDNQTLLNTYLFGMALGYHSLMSALDDWHGVPTTLINGTGGATPTGVNIYQRAELRSTSSVVVPLIRWTGDGVVDSISARMEGPGASFLGNATTCEVNVSLYRNAHMGLIQNADVLRFIDGALGIESAVPCPAVVQPETTIPTAPNTVAANAPTTSGTQIIASGVSGIQAQDDQNNITGLDPASGLVGQTIPGSLYASTSDVATVALAGGRAYTLTVSANGESPVDIQLVRTSGNGVVVTQLYVGIPATAQTRIRLVGDPYQVDTWQIDVSGSGSFSGAISPTTTVWPGQQPDTEPPLGTTILLDGPRSPQGWFTGSVTVTLSAYDPSGISRIEYMLIGEAMPHVYSGPFVVQDPSNAGELRTVAVDTFGNRQAFVSTASFGPNYLYLPALNK